MSCKLKGHIYPDHIAFYMGMSSVDLILKKIGVVLFCFYILWKISALKSIKITKLGKETSTYAAYLPY